MVCVEYIGSVVHIAVCPSPCGFTFKRQEGSYYFVILTPIRCVSFDRIKIA